MKCFTIKFCISASERSWLRAVVQFLHSPHFPLLAKLPSQTTFPMMHHSHGAPMMHYAAQEDADYC